MNAIVDSIAGELRPLVDRRTLLRLGFTESTVQSRSPHCEADPA